MINFEIILCLAFCILCVTCHEENKFLRCVNETGASQEEAENVLNRDIPETENEKCLTKCVLTELGIMNTENRINLKRVAELLEGLKGANNEDYNSAYKVFEDCDNEMKEDLNLHNKCESAKLMVECVFPKFQV